MGKNPLTITREVMNNARGLTLDVYRGKHYRPDAITGRHDSLTLIGWRPDRNDRTRDGFHLLNTDTRYKGPSRPHPDAPPVILDRFGTPGAWYLNLTPLLWDATQNAWVLPEWGMAGFCVAGDSDSRFADLTRDLVGIGPVALRVHDHFERPADLARQHAWPTEPQTA